MLTMNNRQNLSCGLASPIGLGQRQRGLVLILVIIVLMVMSIAGTALMRSVYTSTKVAANLTFQQAALHSADIGVATAVRWLEANNAGTTLHNNIATVTGPSPVYGYFATRADPPASTSWDAYWTSTIASSGRVNTLSTDSAGNSVAYVIHRLCDIQGDPRNPAAGVTCETPPALDASGGNATGGGAALPITSATQFFYRITVRVTGPKNTRSYVQAVVAL
jgi:type IV pilus assembly protein PilX